VAAARLTLTTGTGWTTVGLRLVLLGALAGAMTALATRAFRSYQRSNPASTGIGVLDYRPQPTGRRER